MKFSSSTNDRITRSICAVFGAVSWAWPAKAKTVLRIRNARMAKASIQKCSVGFTTSSS